MRWLECQNKDRFPIDDQHNHQKFKVSFKRWNWPFPTSTRLPSFLQLVHQPFPRDRVQEFPFPRDTLRRQRSQSKLSLFLNLCVRALGDYLASKKSQEFEFAFFFLFFFFYPYRAFDMERRSRNWTLGFSLIAFFGLLFSIGFVSPVKADDVQDYGTVIGIVCCLPSPFHAVKPLSQPSDD